MWQKSGALKKTIFTLNVNDYSPEITALTYPLLEGYAKKIGADFHIISERKHPDFPPVYEKLQIYDLAREMENDWNLYIDSDAVIHPDIPDWTNFLDKDTIAHNGTDNATIRWKYDRYFWRDGRHIGSCNWFAMASDWCVELWKPLDITLAEAVANINLTNKERTTVLTPDHLIDDYALSRNIAKYGLKVKTIADIQKECNVPGGFHWHEYTLTVEDKVAKMKKLLKDWNLS